MKLTREQVKEARETYVTTYGIVESDFLAVCDQLLALMPEGEVKEACERLQHYYNSDIRISSILHLADCETVANHFLNSVYGKGPR